jgi:hypothetical protein
LNDLIFIVVTLAFFALAALYVRFCDSIVGPDDPAAPGDEPSELEEVAA